MKVRMSYHRFNNLAKLLNEDLAVKKGQEILYRDLMDIECNCSLQSKVNGKCVCQGKFRSEYLIFEVKFSTCDAIYTDNTQQTQKNGLLFIQSLTYTQEQTEIRFVS